MTITPEQLKYAIGELHAAEQNVLLRISQLEVALGELLVIAREEEANGRGGNLSRCVHTVAAFLGIGETRQ